ncbi:MAG: hypothetical protein OEM23_04295 [Gemmatimonadota bacterium]|nr:hypothetical protein [Gemmatimonadota bacterium]
MAARISPVPDWVPGDLPGSPGVYQFVDALGNPIYIGKSVNLRRRVRSYFYGGGPKDARLRDMLRLARGVTVSGAGTDLEACLEEAAGIALHRPAFNRVGKNRSRGWYVELDWSVPFPRFRIVRRTRRARAQYIGPFRGRRVPEDAVKLVEKIYRLRTCPGSIRPDPDGSPCLQHGIDQCSAPCVGLIGLDAYRRQIARAARSLVDAAAADDDMRLLRTRLAELRTDGWASISLRRRLEWFEELESYRHGLQRPTMDDSRLIVLPAATPGRRVLVPVARGRVLDRTTIDPSQPDWADRLENVCYQVRLEELRAESAFPVAELTLALIVAAWVRDGARDGLMFDLERMSARDIVEALAVVHQTDRALRPSFRVGRQRVEVTG